MSTLSRIVSDMFGTVFPRTCPVCGDLLADNERFVCAGCRFRVPLTGFCNEADNPMFRRLEGLLPVSRASAFMWFTAGSRWQGLIHDFKYGGRWLYARRMGEWYGELLAESGLYGGVDLVVPVPLHWRKRLSRGYNQAEYIADGIGRALGVKVDRRSVVRRVDNPSQTQRNSRDRWANVEGIFAVRRHGALDGRHILLVDDVFTTGATVVECGSAILAAAKDVTLSVAALAVTQQGMMIDR